ncbi:MAG TPA: helix-turn-helix domain-containing protein [Candidatus Saccharimonadales bacterium]|nr:helix-turn-helix domain-containing protein [Candidatus Saccharimonadales bacterium]
MPSEIFSQIGLNEHQTLVYKYLLEQGPTPPPTLAKKLKLTRSNAYKVLDSLVELGLVSRAEMDKKLIYKAEDPIALASIVAEERNRVIALEKSVREAMLELQRKYRSSASKTELQTYHGTAAIKALHEHQAKLQAPIYYIKTRADIPFMGFETMVRIRKLAMPYKTQRYGIIPDTPEATTDPRVEQPINLERTWIPAEEYTAPVEWSVSADEMIILIYDNPASGILIKNQVIADAFRQLWQVMSDNLKANPKNKKLPQKAKHRA